MPRCANCNRMIVFGGRRHGDSRFCNERCLVSGLLLIHGEGEEDGRWGFREAVLGLHSDLATLTAEVQTQRAMLTEALERLDVVERALAQLRDA